MRILISLALLVAFSLSAHSEVPSNSSGKQAMAVWLSRQLERPVDVSQVLAGPERSSLEGCTITHVRTASIGATLLRLRCPEHPLPQLVLLQLSSDNLTAHFASAPSPTSPASIVRAGASLRADWSTPALHAQLPVIALESGSPGDAIRVRVPNTHRILRARILSLHTVAVLSPGSLMEPS